MFTCNGFLVALPEVDQVPEAWIQLIHHNLVQRTEIKAYGANQQVQLFLPGTNYTFSFASLTNISNFFLEKIKKGLADNNETHEAIFVGVGGEEKYMKTSALSFCSINTTM